tara:strand:+ start:59 stop:472 length:414 start_codon:yes stop_codon:yes gene_type:complete
MSQNLFSKRFDVLIEQDISTDIPSPDEQAAAADLDPGTSPDAYDDVQGGDAVAAVKTRENVNQIHSLKDWIEELNVITERMNGLGSNSMQSILNNAACDTLFADIPRSETKKIGRIAQDMRALSESLKAYLLSSDEG